MSAPATGQGEWRLRDLREALRDNQLQRDALSQSLRKLGDALRAERGQLATHEARYGRLDRGPCRDRLGEKRAASCGRTESPSAASRG